ncbi:30S ribosomal protein S6--L-glutamate ligase [Lujinxingia litoralis]|uniref:Probable alpha-L-glutamate ligase n=1 Tax=Lujinxingia litoralis TaxID=2211119 RepID=A0A328C2X8_9DELT|nr:30S ribosomal protein S6--L-glutamate ligase [Lujinxingia litoralis]RAL20787.1 30S ribosomal protein S6--L-glutamate ligase [Lujinxingia litoralis]
MKIAILSRKSSLYSTRRLREAAAERGHDVQIVDYLRCFMDITSRRPRVMLAGEELEGIEAVVPRIGATYTFYGLSVVRQFEMMGVFSANTSQGISRSRDKLRAMQLLARAGVDMPVTGFLHSTKDVDGVIDTVGGAPLVIKLLEGTQGIGVVLAETRKAAQSVIEAFRGLDANILLQEYIAEAAGADIRAFVVGDEVVAAMKRQAQPGEFRSNLHRGGHATVAELSDEERETALLAAQTMGLSVAGVDLLRSARGPMVIEVNSSPGLEGIEQTTGVDVASKVIEFIEENVSRGAARDTIHF